MTSPTADTIPARSPAFNGRIVGGQQPISGASIYLYQVGVIGNGTGAVNLLQKAVTTGADGSFSITSDYTCPTPTSQMYLVGAGGNPGMAAGTNNSASVLMAPLGDCGNLTPNTYIFVDEVTTAAAAWALAPFLGPNAEIGSAPTNATGLRNAFLVANNLVNIATGVAGGSNLPAHATLEASKLNTLADALAVCVNSNGGAACTPLFSAAAEGGVTPSNTLDAAISIVRHPASQVAAVFNAASAQGPFQPMLTKVPNDWTMTIHYAPGGITLPTGIAVDSGGNLWIANYSASLGSVAIKISAAGVPASASGFYDPIMVESYGITVDPFDNVWITNEQSVFANNDGNGSLTKFDKYGNLLSGSTGYLNGGIYFPYAAASDTAGNIWVADYGNSNEALVSNNDSPLGGTPYGPTRTPFPWGVAVDAAGDGWFATQASVARVTQSGATIQTLCCREPSGGIAIDQNGSVWLADYTASGVVQVNSAGVVLQSPSSVGGLYYPQGLAIDGAGAVWVANYHGASISELGSATNGASSAVLSPSTGFGLDSALGEPFGIAVDASGNVWVANSNIGSVTQFVGLATPLKTPVLGPASQP